MAPFSLPAPCIIPLRLPVFGGPKSIGTNTKIQLFCETQLNHEIFFTLDGTKPQPYAGIVQGSKLIKYCSPFCLPSGKITIRAIAINANIHTMCSSVITKCFEVLKTESVKNKKQSAKVKQTKYAKPKSKFESVNNKNEGTNIQDKANCDVEINRFNPVPVKVEEDILNCFDEAFIGDSEFGSENSDLEDSIEDESSFPINNGISRNNGIPGESDDIKLCDVGFINSDKNSLSDDIEEISVLERNMGGPNVTLTNDNDTTVGADTQFCCLKCDLTLQQCISCNKMNGVSSKFCIGCGKQLSRICSYCSQYNPGVASFCQYCGNKLFDSKIVKPDPFFRIDQVDHSSMAKPESKNAAIQMLPLVMDKNTQTVGEKSPVKKSPDLKRVSSHSPGRGYWHQQVDYICNHIKTHAYNNLEFRKEIGEPMLCDFKSAHITQDENSVTVTVVFSPLKDKHDPSSVSEKNNSKGKDIEDTPEVDT